jgi:hypothetical protein
MAKARYMREGQKNGVVTRLLDRKFDPIRDKLDARKKDWAYNLVRSQLTPAQWEMAERLPEGWLPLMTHVRLSVLDNANSSAYETWTLEEALFAPSNLFNKRFGELDVKAEVWAERVAIEAAIKANAAARAQAKREADALLGTFRTVEAAIEGWPEAASIIQQVCGAAKPTQLPALTSLNAALDLPPEAREKAA